MSSRRTHRPGIVLSLILTAAIATPALAARDADNDGVRDRKDRCPETLVGTKVDRHGCPMDWDQDGVDDGIDRCGGTPQGWPVDREGCPRDTDADGVPDGADGCSSTPRDAIVDARGCPSDADGDGVLDGLDRCAQTPSGADIDRLGCPIDPDHDGVPDGIDRCPGTRHATPVDADGCDATPKADPIFATGQTSIVLGGVTFETNGVQIAPDSATQLSHLAHYLRDWPEIVIEIRAYTDAPGGRGLNQDLSERRAEVVKAYLEAKGIDAARLKARGMGERSPIADNSTPDGRAKNRRIEIVLLSQDSAI